MVRRPAGRLAFTVEDLLPEARCADLVVWGTAPIRSLKTFFLGQPVEALLRAARRPVLVVRREARAGLPAPDRCRRLHGGVARARRSWLRARCVGPGRAVPRGEHRQRGQAPLCRSLGPCHQGLPPRMPTLGQGQDVLADGLVRFQAQSGDVRHRPRSSGREMSARWLDGNSMVLAFMRRARKRSRSGSIVRSFVEGAPGPRHRPVQQPCQARRPR